MADHLRISDARIADIVDSYPRGGLTWVLATELELLRAAGDRLVQTHSDDLCDCERPECAATRAAHAGWEQARHGTNRKPKRKHQ